MSRLQSAALGAALLALSLQCGWAVADNYDDASRLFKQGNHAAALEKIEAAITANPRDARARFLKGLILTEQHKPNDATGRRACSDACGQRRHRRRWLL